MVLKVLRDGRGGFLLAETQSLEGSSCGFGLMAVGWSVSQ